MNWMGLAGYSIRCLAAVNTVNEHFEFDKMFEFLFHQHYHRKVCVVGKDIGLGFWLIAVLTLWLVDYIYIYIYIYHEVAFLPVL